MRREKKLLNGENKKNVGKNRYKYSNHLRKGKADMFS